jgi:amino acid transporter
MASTSSTDAQPRKYGLSPAILSPIESFGQAIAGIAPTAAPAMTIAIVAGMAGNAVWFTYLLATSIIFFTALSINVFATRTAGAGSLYTYATAGGGTLAGFLAGWSMLGSYVLGLSCCAIQVTIFLNQLIADMDVKPPFPLALVTLCLLVSSAIAYKNIKLSAEFMLWMEVASVIVICVLAALSLANHGFSLDMHQLKLSGTSPQGICRGLVIAILAFVGFETAATLGEEAKMPLAKIPQAMIRSVLISGIFFVVSAYAIVQGFEGIPVKLESCATPLVVLADHLGVNWMGRLLNLAGAASLFAACLAATNAAARIMLAMTCDGFFYTKLATIHPSNRTPSTAIILTVLIAFAVSVLLIVCGNPLIDIVGWLGTLGTYGYLFSYSLVSITSVLFLAKRRELNKTNVIVAALTTVSMLGVLLGTVYPLPPPPYSWLPAICLVYLALGVIYCWHVIARARPPGPPAAKSKKTSEKTKVLVPSA